MSKLRRSSLHKLFWGLLGSQYDPIKPQLIIALRARLKLGKMYLLQDMVRTATPGIQGALTETGTPDSSMEPRRHHRATILLRHLDLHF